MRAMIHMNTDELEHRILKVIARAGSLTDVDLSVMFGRRALSVLSSLEARNLVRRESGKWLVVRVRRQPDNNSNNALETEGGKPCRD
jgi:hypothetical protein